MTSHTEVLDLIALYALDALERNEEIAVEEHVRGCPVCPEEVDLCRLVAGTLIPDAPAPSHLWDRIARSIATSH